jgi:multiple sugar transport system substrate-binding protein
MKKRRISPVGLVLLCLSMATVFVSCSKKDKAAGGSSGAIEIVYWHTHGDAEEALLKDRLIPRFEQDNPDIKIKPVRMPYDGLKQQVVQGVASSTAPDLMRLDIIWTPEFAHMGALVALDDLPGFAALKDRLYQGPLSTNLSGGKYYGLPINTNTKAGIYSRGMLQKLGFSAPPKTFDEILAQKGKLGPEEYLICADGANSWSLAPLFFSLGGRYTNDDYTKATGAFNSEASINAIETIVKWYDDGTLSPALLGGKPDKNNGMIQNQVLATDEGPWFFPNLLEEELVNVVAGLYPSGPGGSVSVVGGENLVMFASGKHHDESWRFAQFLLGEFAQKAIAEVGLIPTVAEYAESPEVINLPNMKAYVDQLETALARTPHHNWEKMSEKIGFTFESIIRKEVNARSEMNKTAAELDALLAN